MRRPRAAQLHVALSETRGDIIKTISQLRVFVLGSACVILKGLLFAGLLNIDGGECE
jgi:hypothetical protein